MNTFILPRAFSTECGKVNIGLNATYVQWFEKLENGSVRCECFYNLFTIEVDILHYWKIGRNIDCYDHKLEIIEEWE